MTEYIRYVGTVIHTKENFGFIDINSVRELDGSPASFSAKNDIFVHRSEAPCDLRVGMELTFKVRCDPEREGELRAWEMILFGIELQFLERVIDHPVVPVSWCIKPEAIELMRTLAADEYYMVIGARERGTDDRPWGGDRSKTILKTVIGLDRIKDGRGYLNFFAPGTYDVFTYLVESKVSRDRLEKSLSELNPDQYDPINEHRGVQITDRTDLPFLRGQNFGRLGNVIGISQLSLEVPDGIFAKPLTGWMKNWFCYFWNDDLLDDCDRRKKLGFAFTLGLPMFFLWEVLKRAWMLVLSVGHFIIGGSPLTLWKRAFAVRLSSTISNLLGKYEYEDMRDYTEWRNWLRPIFPLLLLAFVAANYYIPAVWEVVSGSLSSIAWVLGIGAGIVVVFVVALYLLDTDAMAPEEVVYSRKQAKLRRQEEEKRLRLDSLLGDVKTYAACGTASASRPASVRLIFSGIKRKLCRNYRKA